MARYLSAYLKRFGTYEKPAQQGARAKPAIRDARHFSEGGEARRDQASRSEVIHVSPKTLARRKFAGMARRRPAGANGAAKGGHGATAGG